MSILFARATTALLGIAVLAGTWDVWWHAAIGRNSFWEPPHLLLYASVLAAIACGWWGWRHTRERVWRRLAIALVLIPASAPFDDLWHRAFGIESLRSPLIIWSPPHLVLIGALVASFMLVLPLVARDRDAHARRLFCVVAIASVLSLMMLVVQPLDPIGPWHLLGFAGAGAMSAVFVAGFLAARRLFSGTGAALTVAVFLIAYSAIGISRGKAPEVDIPPHDHPPFWLSTFALLATAVLVDVMGLRWPRWVVGVASGAVWSVLLFGFMSRFLEPTFQYGVEQAVIAIVTSITGGAIAGVMIGRWSCRVAAPDAV